MKTSQAVRDLVRERDGYRCVRCGTYGGKNNRLTIHHRKPRCDYPELGNDPDNCELLCTICHRKEHKLKTRRRRKCTRGL